jgi:hypothetical protein
LNQDTWHTRLDPKIVSNKAVFFADGIHHLQGFHPVMIDTIRIVNNNPSPLDIGLVNGVLQKGKGTYA